MTTLNGLTHQQARSAQVTITYLWLVGVFAITIMEGFGIIKVNVTEHLSEITMLVMSFWFQRQRDSTGGINLPPKDAKPPLVQSPTEKVQ